MKINAKTARKFAASLRYSGEGLVPVAVCDAASNQLLMLAFASEEAVIRTLVTGNACFFSRSRKTLWKKGETSGNVMKVASVSVDCDADAIQYSVEMEGAGNACHKGRKSCFVRKFGGGKDKLTIAGLSGIIEKRIADRVPGSYTLRLASSRKLACAKIKEESEELVEALKEKNKREVVWEACDLIYHALVAARARGVSLADLERELARRNREKKK